MRSSAKLLLPLFLALLLGAAWGGSSFLTAQETPPMTPTARPAAVNETEPEPLKVDLEVRVLNLRVTVQDKSGHFVQGLSPGDFQLMVKRRELPVRLFHEVRDGKALFPEIEAREGETAAVDAGQGVQEAGGEPIHYVFFFDNLHMAPENRPRVVSRLNHFVDEIFTEQDKALVVNFEQGFNLNTRFTSNPNVLKDSIKRASMQAAFPGGLAGEGASSIYGEPFSEIGDRTLGEKSYYAKLSCEALGTLSTFLAGVPGRKVIVFLSEELPVEMGPGLRFGEDRGSVNQKSAGAFNEKEALFETVRQLNAAEIPVFALDARGLSAETRLVSVSSGG